MTSRVASKLDLDKEEDYKYPFAGEAPTTRRLGFLRKGKNCAPGGRGTRSNSIGGSSDDTTLHHTGVTRRLESVQYSVCAVARFVHLVILQRQNGSQRRAGELHRVRRVPAQSDGSRIRSSIKQGCEEFVS